MVKNVCQTYLKGLKEFHFKLSLALALASGATRPHLGVSEHPLNPQFQGLKTDFCGYCHSNYFSRSAPEYVYTVIHDVVSRVMRFARNIICLDRWIYISLVIKFSLKIDIGMDNPVTGLTIK